MDEFQEALQELLDSYTCKFMSIRNIAGFKRELVQIVSSNELCTVNIKDVVLQVNHKIGSIDVIRFTGDRSYTPQEIYDHMYRNSLDNYHSTDIVTNLKSITTRETYEEV